MCDTKNYGSDMPMLKQRTHTIELDYSLNKEHTPSPEIDSTRIREEILASSMQHIMVPGQVISKRRRTTKSKRSNTSTLVKQLGNIVTTILILVKEIRGQLIIQQLIQKEVT